MANKVNVGPGQPIVGFEDIEIASLSNSMNYFMNSVFILKENEGYRLLAFHNDLLLTDEMYKSAKGAKIAFLKLFWYRAWREDVKPEWTHFYIPDAEWLGEKLNNPKLTA